MVVFYRKFFEKAGLHWSLLCSSNSGMCSLGVMFTGIAEKVLAAKSMAISLTL
jgi:hypothetical protein